MSGLSELGRFSEPALLILVSLADGAKHGYAIQDEIAALYGAIRRLEEREYIESLPEQARRKPYQLTDKGRAALRAELRRMQAVVHTGLRRLAVS
jgi:DNA-binding PadR family transcriptional regulator